MSWVQTELSWILSIQQGTVDQSMKPIFITVIYCMAHSDHISIKKHMR